MKQKIAVFASGSGSNFEAVVQASRSGALEAEIVGLLVNRPTAGAVVRAQKLGVPFAIVTPRDYTDRSLWDQAVLKTVQAWGAEWIVLAGFLTLIGPRLLAAYPDRIVNVHPALLPQFGGPGMFGARVHEAVIASGAQESGLTVHLVNAEYDRGRILHQARLKLNPGETAASLEKRIRELEHAEYPRIINNLVTGRITNG